MRCVGIKERRNSGFDLAVASALPSESLNMATHPFKNDSSAVGATPALQYPRSHTSRKRVSASERRVRNQKELGGPPALRFFGIGESAEVYSLLCKTAVSGSVSIPTHRMNRDVWGTHCRGVALKICGPSAFR
jgi:hypothetical protein